MYIRNQCFSYYFCLIEESGYGSVYLTIKSGYGTGRSKNIWILRIRIRNTGWYWYYKDHISLHIRTSWTQMQEGKNWIMPKEINKCKPLLLRLSLAENLEKQLMSLYGTEWIERGYGLCRCWNWGNWGLRVHHKVLVSTRLLKSSSSSIIYSRKNSPYNFTYKVTFILRFFRYSGLLVHQFFLPIYFALSRHCAHVLQDDIALFDFAHPPFFLCQTSAPHMKNKTRQ